jgi:predicted ATP-dependent endonuclease of OLD family
MKIVGIEIRNFRNFGERSVLLYPLQKCNVLVGQNNCGKSNILKAVTLLSDNIRKGKTFTFSELDANNRDVKKPFIYKIWYELDKTNPYELELINITEISTVWFELSWVVGSNPTVIDYTFANITEFKQSNKLLQKFNSQIWNVQVSPEVIKKTFLGFGNNVFNSHFSNFPVVYNIPEFRQIKPGKEYSLDGSELIGHLAKLHSPKIGQDKEQEKFYKIQEFLRLLLDLPNAILEISRENPTIIINNDGLRLPLSSYGTGVHELLILVSAVTSIENSICCIEEPEIHLYPKLQNRFIDFILRETTNQYYISSHSHTIINKLSNSSDIQVFHIIKKDNEYYGKPILDKLSAIDLLDDLGIKISDLD